MIAPATAQLVTEAEISTLTPERVFFWIIAAVVIGGALFTITRKNAIAAVMSLVGTFFGLAACYALLSAHFLAALQVLVYAGAIMVLFIFVVMVLNRDDNDRVAWRGVLSKMVGAGAVGYLAWVIVYYVQRVVPAHPEPPSASFGTVAEVGEVLFTDYLFAFEAVSVLLLIAVIAAIVVARAHKTPDAHAAEPAPDGGTHS